MKRVWLFAFNWHDETKFSAFFVAIAVIFLFILFIFFLEGEKKKEKESNEDKKNARSSVSSISFSYPKGLSLYNLGEPSFFF